MKLGVGIVTYNSEKYFDDLYKSLPLDKIDEIVVVNGGDPYKKKYKHVDWIQHHVNAGPARSRNDCLGYLIERDVDYYCIIEDDMIIKSPDVFDKYIDALETTKLGYLCFVSMSLNCGGPGNRNLSHVVQYSSDTEICYYPNMCNEFTIKTKKCLLETGKYDTRFYSMWDVANVYMVSQSNHMQAFWYFPDISNSDELIMNNPQATSRINESGKRDSRLLEEKKLFAEICGVDVSYIPKLDSQQFIQHIKP